MSSHSSLLPKFQERKTLTCMCFHAWAVTNTLGHNSSFFPALRGSVRVRTNLEGRIGSGLRVSCQFAKKFPTGFCPTTAKRGLTTWAFVQPPGESLSSYRLGNRLSVFQRSLICFSLSWSAALHRCCWSTRHCNHVVYTLNLKVLLGDRGTALLKCQL